MFQHGHLLGERESMLIEGERETFLAVNGLAYLYYTSVSSQLVD